MISPNISMASMRLPMPTGPRGPTQPIRPQTSILEQTSALLNGGGGPTIPPRGQNEPQTSNSKSTPAGMKMTNFSIAAIMNNGQQNNDRNKLNQSKLEKSLGKIFI